MKRPKHTTILSDNFRAQWDGVDGWDIWVRGTVPPVSAGWTRGNSTDARNHMADAEASRAAARSKAGTL